MDKGVMVPSPYSTITRNAGLIERRFVAITGQKHSSLTTILEQSLDFFRNQRHLHNKAAAP
jgi:hypothetical protein